MVLFPDYTKVEKKIPKTKFYENTEISSKLKKKFVDFIDSIFIRNHLSQNTLNLSPTKNIEEFFVFEIILKDSKYINNIEDLLLCIDRSIPYPILFCFKLKDRYVLKVAKKTRNKVDEDKFVVDIYLTKEVLFCELDNFEKEIKEKVLSSLNLEVLYNELLKLFLVVNSNCDVDELIEKHKKVENLKKEIEKLEKIVITEKQTDKQFEFYKELELKKKELESLK